jgi:hypothetical protein
MQVETLMEKTDRMLSALGAIPMPEKAPVRDMASLWQSGLTSSLLFSVDEPVGDATAEDEAKSIIARHLECAQMPAASMSGLIDFQSQLQMRSKVISAIETLLRG